MDDYTIIIEEFRKRGIKPGQLRSMLSLLDKAFLTFEVGMIILEVALDLKKDKLGY